MMVLLASSNLLDDKKLQLITPLKQTLTKENAHYNATAVLFSATRWLLAKDSES